MNVKESQKQNKKRRKVDIQQKLSFGGGGGILIEGKRLHLYLGHGHCSDCTSIHIGKFPQQRTDEIQLPSGTRFD